MNILFFGTSSFTGFHFVKELAKDKKKIIYCVLTKKITRYSSLKKTRLEKLIKIKNVKIIDNMSFGEKKMILLIKSIKFKYICFHHAETKNYNNDKKFNIAKAIKSTTKNINEFFQNLSSRTIIIISNTIYQEIKKRNYNAITNYGKSKTIIYEILKKICNKNNIQYKSIFIPNPWGPYEEKRLNFNLIINWQNDQLFELNFPKYIRDNIYIDKLTKTYLKMFNKKSKKKEYFPTGYKTSNKNFVLALKNKFEKFHKKHANVIFNNNNYHDLPISRINMNEYKKKIIIRENLNEYFNYYKNMNKNLI